MGEERDRRLEKKQREAEKNRARFKEEHENKEKYELDVENFRKDVLIKPDHNVEGQPKSRTRNHVVIHDDSVKTEDSHALTNTNQSWAGKWAEERKANELQEKQAIERKARE